MLFEVFVVLAVLFVWLPTVSFLVGVLLRYSVSKFEEEFALALFVFYFIFIIIIPTASLALWGYDESMPGLAGKIVNIVFALPATLAVGPTHPAPDLGGLKCRHRIAETPQIPEHH